ncbi:MULTISPECIES: SDR family oxidoreductase [Brevibacterium]|uniref:SDR family oxidoreductase n=1 Tax=Brevibacterium TaxID=1696 RepID=UPI001F1E33F5|nr:MULTISPECIES: SDR family oxidoreductase [Brevibacterium]
MTAGQDYDTSNQAIDRLGVPAEIAEAVAYLASDGAAFTTGQILRIDGGAVMS